MLFSMHKQWAVWLVAIALFLTSCTTPTTTTEAPAIEPAAVPEQVAVAPSDALAGLAQLKGKATVEMVVNGETITLEVDGEKAPVTAGNFVDLVQLGVYDGTVFHRVVREPQPFVVQGGDPQSKDPSVPLERLGTGSFLDPETNQPRYIPLEITPANAEQPIYGSTFETAGITEPPALTHTRGAVAMARSQFPDSASAQFYFALSDLPFLDGSYAVFGKVTQGLEVIDAIQQGDKIESAKVVSGLENLEIPNAPAAAADSNPPDTIESTPATN